MANRRVYHVTRDARAGDWVLKEEGAQRAVGRFGTKDEAVDRGKKVAGKQDLGQLVIHKKDGEFQSECTYGKDAAVTGAASHGWTTARDLDIELGLLRSSYSVEFRGNVGRFLEDRQSLVDLLPETLEQLRRYFGFDAALVLEVVVDPDDGSEELFALVQTRLEPDDVMQRRGRLLDEWWLPGPGRRVSHGLNVGVEYL